MKKTKFHRLIALVLAFVFLFGSALTINAATEGGDGSTTDKTLDDIREHLNTVTYDSYMLTYADVERATAPIRISGGDYAELKGITEEDVTKIATQDGEALFTPSVGAVTWKVPAGAITKPTKYSIVVEYMPDGEKSTAIERTLKVNGKLPFIEARYLSLPKTWRYNYGVAKVTDPKGDCSVQQLYEAAIAAGFPTDSVRIGGSDTGACVEIDLPDVWTQSMGDYVNRYTVRFFETDNNNSEIRPTMEQELGWFSYELRDADGFYAETLEFVLAPDENGEVSISLEAIREPVTVKAIVLIPHEDLIDYETYRKQFEGVESGTDKIYIQSEYINASSTQNVYPLEDRSDAANMPTDTTRTLLNTIGGDKWQTVGQWVRYSFKVEKSGMYHIATRYRQNVLDGMYVCRSLRIASKGADVGTLGYYDGGIPFYEASQIRFNYSSDWQSMLLNNGSTDEGGNPIAYEFYFEAGVEYTVEMEVTLGSMGEIIRRVEEILDSINSDYLSIIKLTGTSPDANRDYNFFTVMPDAMIDMLNRSEELYELADQLAKATGEKSSNVATLEKIAWTLKRIGSSEDEVVTYLDQLKSYIGSLGTWLGDAKTQPLQLDYIVIQPTSSGELPKAKAGFLEAMWHEIKSFFMSFFRNYDNMSADGEEGTEAVDVWIATGRDQAQVLRTLITNDFMTQSALGTAVNLKLINGGALLPSVLAGIGPDVYIGVGEGTVINYAIRGALLPIEKMEGFAEYALEYEVDKETFKKIYDENGNPIRNENAQFNEAAMLVLGLEDAENVFHYYGLPISQDFSMMFVRDDILADLGIEIPRTWDDVLAAVPVLQANNMEIGMHKNYNLYLYQMGGELFADGGMRINLDSNLALEAFETMCNNFTMYSFPVSYNFANRFRTGEMPIGFGDYNDTYNQMTVFATEIKGLWEFLPMPGIEHTREDGTTYINNVSVATTTAICMMNGCDQAEKAWEFMKWYTGADCQVKYSNEMVALLGPSAKPACANINALQQMPWTAEEYKQIAYQFNNLASIPDYPGTYIIGRYTNFAFLAAYNDNADPVDELLGYISTINKEITRKRAEFGLETLELGQTLAEKRLLQVEQAYAADIEDMDQGKIDAAAFAVDIMNNGIEDVDSVALSNAADAFAAVDATAFAATITALRNAVTVLLNRR